MKILFTTVMVLGAVFMLEAIQPVEAALTSPVISNTDHSQTTPTRWHYFYHWHWRHW
jgi:hypothetical protein